MPFIQIIEFRTSRFGEDTTLELIVALGMPDTPGAGAFTVQG